MSNQARVLITGANGFLGTALAQHLAGRFALVLAVRSEASVLPDQGTVVAVGDINAATDWSQALAGVDTVVHCAARAHVMNEGSSDPLEEYRKVNVEGTRALVQQAAQAGVKRFVFVSSIKVNGESTTGRQPYGAELQPAPEDAYGQSKHEAEQVLLRECAAAGMELVIIRPPLLYGPGVKANFRSLCQLAAKPLPLPFGAIRNRRSMLYVGNLCNFIEACMTHEAAANQTFVIADGEDVSLRQLLVLMRRAMGRRPGLLPVSAGLFRLAGRLTGKQAVVDRVVGDLQVDISKARELLGWQAPFSVEQGIAATVAGLVQEPAAACSPSPLLRLFDVFFAVCGLLFGFPVLLAIYVLGLFDTGSPLFLQERVGRNKKPFTLVKFRTMKVDTASVASHLASAASITRMGGFLRKTKLDELPQLWNVLKGEMSLVGPRPNLFNQHELIAERDALGVYNVRPGITGLAQVNEIDMSTPKLLAETDARMIDQMTLGNYFRFIVQTVTGKGSGDRVRSD